jgi:hypothetical protein
MTHMKTKSFAISPALQTPKGLKILPNNRLPSPYKGITQSHGINKHIPPSRNFFYKILSGTATLESGIAELHKDGNDYIISREFAFTCCEDNCEKTSRNNIPQELTSDTIYVVRSYVPECYIHTLASPNSVLCSIEPFCPTPIEVESHSVLARVNDSDLDSVSIKDLGKELTPFVLDGVNATTSPFIMMTDQVELMGVNSRIACNTLWLKTGPKPKRRSAGMLHYNETDKVMEYFDGTGWRTLVWQSSK